MKWFADFYGRKIRLSHERLIHIEYTHPEMSKQADRINETLLFPDVVIESITDPDVELFYKHYDKTPVTEKYLCVVIKLGLDDAFILTAYFTDSIKKGKILWKKK